MPSWRRDPANRGLSEVDGSAAVTSARNAFFLYHRLYEFECFVYPNCLNIKLNVQTCPK